MEFFTNKYWDTKKDLNTGNAYKIQILHVLSAVFFLINLLMLFLSLWLSEFLLAGAYAAFAVLTATNTFYLRRAQSTEIAAFFLLIFLTILLILSILTNKIIFVPLLWSFLYPIYSVLAVGWKRGGVISFLFLLALNVLFVVYPQFFVHNFASSHVKIQFIFSYLAVLLIMLVYNYFSLRKREQINELLAKNESLIQEKQKFLSQLSYQIRISLNNILGSTDLMDKYELNEVQRDFVNTIEASAKNLESLVDTINQTSRTRISVQADSELVFNLLFTVQNTLRVFSNLKQNSPNFSLTFSKKIPSKLKANPIKIKQILLSLIESLLEKQELKNADFPIEVGIHEETETTVVCFFKIAHRKPNILSLQKVKTNSEYIKILNLGLTKDLIEEGGGHFHIDVLGDRFLLNFYCPFSKVQAMPEKKLFSKNNTSFSKKNSINLADSKVLLVEDNPINQKIMQLNLKRLVKNIAIAVNGKEALEMFGTNKYDVILMDIQMPIMNGIEASIKLREIEAKTNSYTPIIALTANALTGDKENCLASGMDDYMTKPIQLKMLVEKMKYHLQHTAK